jgi:D-serine deaminase-like pyridoxal phosphate-dependent protein
MAFNGRSYAVEDTHDVATVSRDETDLVLHTAELLRAAGLEVPVVSVGSKALPKEIMSRLTVGYGTVLGYPGLVIERVSEEASVMVWRTPHHVDPPRFGDQVQIVSNHCCSATYLFSDFLLIDGGEVERLPVGARTR